MTTYQYQSEHLGTLTCLQQHSTKMVSNTIVTDLIVIFIMLYTKYNKDDKPPER